MRKAAYIGLIVLGLIAIGLAILPRLVSSDAVREAMLLRAYEITGRTMQFSGSPKIKVSPYLGIEVHNVSFRGNSGNDQSPTLLQMPILAGKLSIAAALRGAIEITEIEFIRPVFKLTVYDSNRTSWTFPEGKMWRALSAARELRAQATSGQDPDISLLEDVRLGVFKITDGAVHYTNAINENSETITSLNGALTWPSLRAPLTFKGSGIWRGESIDGSFDLQMPIMLLAGGASSISVNFNSEPLNLKFEGETNRLADIFFSGTTSVESASLRRLITFLGGSIDPGTGFEAFTANGELSGTPGDIQLANSTILLDGNRYVGNLRLTLEAQEQNKLSGTLAANRLDLQPYSSLVLDAQNRTAAMSLLSQTSADIRFSANNVDIGTTTVGDFAGSLIGRRGDVKLDIGTASFGDGSLAGTISYFDTDDNSQTPDGESEGEQKPRLKISLDAININPAQLAIFRDNSLLIPEGPSDMRIRVVVLANEKARISETINGEVSLKMDSGSITGLNFSEVLKNLKPGEASAENVPLAAPLSATAVTDFLLDAALVNGTAWLKEGEFVVSDYKANLFGKAALTNGALAIWGAVMPAKAEQENSSNLVREQFFIGGTIGQPLILQQERVRLAE